MAVNNFIPRVWASQVLLNLHKTQVWGQPGVANTDYEGDIANQGDSVQISAIGPVTVRKLQKNVDIVTPDTLADASTVLTIDQADYFNFQISDVDKAQVNVDLMQAAMWEAAYAISNAADFFIATQVLNAANNNVIGTDAAPVALTVTAGISPAYDYMVQARVKLLEANVSPDGMWAIVPPFYAGMLARDDRFVKFGTPAQTERLVGGLIGEAAGFKIYQSNNVPITNSSGTITNAAGTLGGYNAGAFNVTLGHPSALSYADQITEMVAYRPEKRFADAVKGLHLYGAKVVRPQALCIIKAAYLNS